MEESEEPDRLSNLPDDLLGLIISNLPTKEAVATSILSRRWRWQWKHLSRLNLKLQNSEFTQSEDFYVNNLFKQLIVPSIKKCEISDYCHVGDRFNGRLIYTVKYLLNHMETEELVIKHVEIVRIEQRTYTVVRSKSFDCKNTRKLEQLFACKNLRKLELQNLPIRDERPFHGCVNLETLKLREVWIYEKTLHDIIRVCGFLENLVIQGCRDLNNFKIDGNNKLKRLEINGSLVHGDVSDFSVKADKLEFLCLSPLGNFPSDYFAMNCPNVRELQLHCRTWTFRVPIPLDCQVFENGTFGIPNLMVLHTTMNLNTMWSSLVLRDLFRECTKLQEVHIVNRDDHRHDDIPNEENFRKTLYIDSLLKHLRLFKIRGFRGTEKEMRLVDYVITSASKLENLVIQFDRMCPEEEVKSKLQEKVKLQILSIPRASFDVSIIFD